MGGMKLEYFRLVGALDELQDQRMSYTINRQVIREKKKRQSSLAGTKSLWYLLIPLIARYIVPVVRLSPFSFFS